MSKDKINICLVNTVYSLFLYFLINGYSEKDIFIFTFLMPKEISKNLKHIQLPYVAFVDGAKMAPLNSIKGIIENIYGYFRYFYGYLKLRIILFIKTHDKEITVYGHAQTPFSYMFYENKNSNIIEDGLMNYSHPILETHEINPLIDKILHFLGIYFLSAGEGLGSHENIKNVYLTQKFSHPLLKNKIQIINMEERWNNLPEEQKSKIINVFNIESKFMNYPEETVLILTQPLSESNLMTFNEEMNIYAEMINKFKDYTPIIKPHPRDEKKYNDIFKDIEILDKNFPIELLNLIGFKPTVVCSIVSTALLNFKESEIYVYEGKLKNKELNKSRNDLIKMINLKNKRND